MSGTSAHPSGIYNVRDYGAVGDGTADDSGAIGTAIAAAAPSSEPTGNTVYLPAGRYLMRSGVNIPPGLRLEGAGWNAPGSQANLFAGTWIFVPAGAGYSPLTMTGSGGSVRNMAFNVPDQSTTGVLASAEPMVHIKANNALVEDICLYNPYGGIYIDGAAQATLRRIFGQPVQYGILIDRSQDTNYIDGVHFWTYWQPPNTAGAAYQLTNGAAIVLCRCDNPMLSNIMAFRYNKGLVLGTSSAGSPHKVHLMNADFDACVTGIDIAAPGQAGYAATLQMANVTVQSPSGPNTPVGHGIWVEQVSAFAMVQAMNLRVAHSGANAIRVDADNVNFYGENVSLENWNGDAGFHIGSRSSFAYLGVGFSSTPGGTTFTPPSQFRRAAFG